MRGQVRPFIGDWPADNFVRWAHALGFLRYGYQGDAFELTEAGKALAQARTQGEELNSQVRALSLPQKAQDPHRGRIRQNSGGEQLSLIHI